MKGYYDDKDITLKICSDDSELIDNEEQNTEIELYGSRDNCHGLGELVYNGGMEEFECGVPTGWKASIPCDVCKVHSPGNVHSGCSSVGLRDCVKLSQKIYLGKAHCFYQFSFFAQLEGSDANLVATITFLKEWQEIPGGKIVVRGEDIPNCPRQFGYYSTISCKAPWGATGAKIEFSVNANGCQTIIIDDVSFIAQ